MPRLDLLSKNLEAISTSGFLLFLFYLVLLFYWVGIHCDIYKSSYNISNISHLNSPPSTIILYCPPLLPISETVSTGMFSFTYMFAQYLHYIHPPVHFPHPLQTPHTGLVLSFWSLIVYMKKNDIFVYLR
jgi:hypothetical protein